VLKVGSKENRINNEDVRTELGILSLEQKKEDKTERKCSHISRE
jgi:hypothetical protein